MDLCAQGASLHTLYTNFTPWTNPILGELGGGTDRSDSGTIPMRAGIGRTVVLLPSSPLLGDRGCSEGLRNHRHPERLPGGDEISARPLEARGSALLQPVR